MENCSSSLDTTSAGMDCVDGKTNAAASNDEYQETGVCPVNRKEERLPFFETSAPADLLVADVDANEDAPDDNSESSSESAKVAHGGSQMLALTSEDFGEAFDGAGGPKEKGGAAGDKVQESPKGCAPTCKESHQVGYSPKISKDTASRVIDSTTVSEGSYLKGYLNESEPIILMEEGLHPVLSRQGAIRPATPKPGAYSSNESGTERRIPPAKSSIRRSTSSDAGSVFPSTTSIIRSEALTLEESARSSAEAAALAVANPVVEHGFPQADEVQQEGTGITNESSKASPFGCFFSVLCLLITAVIAIVLGSVMVNKGSEKEPAPHENTNTSKAPSADIYILPLLPNYTKQELQDPNSPQSKAYQWLLQDPSLSSYSEWRLHQRLALAAFFYATGGPTWLNNTNWLSHEHHECTWYNSPRPTNLMESSDSLNIKVLNSFPPPYWTDMCTNGSTGVYQHLHHVHNDLQGSLPKELFWLTSLKTMLFPYNSLTGQIPSQVGSLDQLEFIGWVKNQLSGTLPTQVGLLTSLRGFSISNKLHGSIPSQIGLLDKLEEIFLGTNELEGTIPVEFGRLPSLRAAFLGSNSITGTLPRELGLLAMLEDLDVYNNQLSGTISTEFGMMSSLERLDISANEFQGSIPSELVQLPSLVHVDFSDNPLLTGTMPASFCDLESIAFQCSEHLCGCDCPCAAEAKNGFEIGHPMTI